MGVPPSSPHVVRKSWVTKPDRETAGFFDSSVFESKQRTGDETVKRFLDEGLLNSSVTCVLVGNETAWRRWVRYELLRSFVEGKGMVGVRIHTIANFQKETAIAGTNPLACLGFEIKNGTLYFKELNGGKWIWSADLRTMPANKVVYTLNGRTNLSFDALFATYDWTGDGGYENLGNWIESAAQAAGR